MPPNEARCLRFAKIGYRAKYSISPLHWLGPAVAQSGKIAKFGEKVERTPLFHRFWRSWLVIGCISARPGRDEWGKLRMTGSPVSSYRS
jgi:hypothetical protein